MTVSKSEDYEVDAGKRVIGIVLAYCERSLRYAEGLGVRCDRKKEHKDDPKDV